MLPAFPEAALEKSLTNSLGIYIHIPFCEKKCNYCDFYSSAANSEQRKRYIERLCQEIKKWGGRTACPIDTLYIGGGTPSLLCDTELSLIIGEVKKNFNLLENAEITCEINPGDNIEAFLKAAKKLGVNRISIGVQSANDTELKVLGRRHNFEDAKETVKIARGLGFNNISTDIMIGLPDSTSTTLENSIRQILALNPEHISAYILKIEEATPFAKMELNLPDDDSIADQYLQVCKAFQHAGYAHYEISNFAKLGFESRHNNRYWNCCEYIGIGPAAHSFFEGKRFFYERNLFSFIHNAKTTDDGEGGSKEEFIMLALRLSKGLVFKEYEERFGQNIDNKIKAKALLFEKQGLCVCDENHIALTDRGMLLSNAIIGELI
jgi:oxygen-independent coproporphyrinogen-3 oxidase